MLTGDSLIIECIEYCAALCARLIRGVLLLMADILGVMAMLQRLHAGLGLKSLA